MTNCINFINGSVIDFSFADESISFKGYNEAFLWGRGSGKTPYLRPTNKRKLPRKQKKTFIKNNGRDAYLKFARVGFSRISFDFNLPKNTFIISEPPEPRPHFADGGLLNPSKPQEYIVPDLQSLLFMKNPNAMTGLDLSQEIISTRSVPLVFDLELIKNNIWKRYKPMMFVPDLPTV